MTLFSHLADGLWFPAMFSGLMAPVGQELAFWRREPAPPAASLGSYSFEGSVVRRSLSLQFPHKVKTRHEEWLALGHLCKGYKEMLNSGTSAPILTFPQPVLLWVLNLWKS